MCGGHGTSCIVPQRVTDYCECGPVVGEHPDAGMTGTPVEEDCTRYPYRAETLLAEREGFGRNARGGDPSRVYRVTASVGSTRATEIRVPATRRAGVRRALLEFL